MVTANENSLYFSVYFSNHPLFLFFFFLIGFIIAE